MGPSWRYPACRSLPKYELTACLFALCGERCVTDLAVDLCVGWAEKKGGCLCVWVSVRVDREIVYESGWGILCSCSSPSPLFLRDFGIPGGAGTLWTSQMQYPSGVQCCQGSSVLVPAPCAFVPWSALRHE